MVALLVAAGWPELVQSLCLIEPAAYAATLDDPVVREGLQRQRAALASLPADCTPKDFWAGSVSGIDDHPPPATPDRLRAAATGLREHPCTEVSVDLAAVEALAIPKMVIGGDWATAPEPYATLGGAPLRRCSDLIAARIGAARQIVAGADHLAHRQQPTIVNKLMAGLWDGDNLVTRNHD